MRYYICILLMLVLFSCNVSDHIQLRIDGCFDNHIGYWSFHNDGQFHKIIYDTICSGKYFIKGDSIFMRGYTPDASLGFTMKGLLRNQETMQIDGILVYTDGNIIDPWNIELTPIQCPSDVE